MRGLVPRWGRGRAWQNPPGQRALPDHNSGFSDLRVPAAAGICDSYESTSRTPIRDVPSNQPRCRLPTGEPRRIVDPWSMARKEECSAGACPPLGSGWGMAESAAQIRPTKPQLQFSYLGVPAPAGMSDSYENMSRTPIRDGLPIRHSGESRSPGVGSTVAMGLLPSQGSPTPRDFHPLLRAPQGHGDSGEEPAPYPDTGPESRGGGARGV